MYNKYGNNTNYRLNMLGINHKRELIKGEFAKTIQDKLCRVQSGQLNKEEKKSITSSKKILSRHKAIWE